MLKDKFAVLSVVSLLLYAVVRFCEEAVETACRVRLIAAQADYAGGDWQVSGEHVRRLLLILAAVCLVIAIVNTVTDAVRRRRNQK